MIKSIKHKGLKDLFYKSHVAGVQADHVNRLKNLLALLKAAETVDNMAFPGSQLHPLKGQLKDHWNVRVDGNWRLTFKFIDGDAYIVDYQDYP